MTFSTRLVFVVVALLTAPIALRGQKCDLPTQEDVESAGGDYLTTELAEGGVPLTMTVHNMHFTCLATVALNKYSYASVVVTATSSGDPSVTQVLQFQLECSSSNEWGTVGTSIFDSDVDSLSDPFNIETDFRCSECREVPISNYNATTNCRYCHPDCGNQFCTGSGSSQCCQGFNNDTGACVDDCITINPNFGPNDDFVCVCQVSCGPGFAVNITDCSCELTDGCEAAGQPCQNGGTCTSDLSAPPYYSCQCHAEYTGQNCATPLESIESVVITAQPGLQVILGESLTLTCTVVATGLEEIIWDGSGLANTDIEVTTNVSTGLSTLTIHAVSASDLGHYSCEAVAGSIEKNTSVIITTNPIKECTVQNSLTVIPNRTPGTIGTSYNFHGTCEHIFTAPCDDQAYKVVGDFLQTNLSTGRVGLVLPGYTAIIDEGLKLIEEGDKPSEVITTQQPEDHVNITLFEGSNLVLSIVRTDDQIVIKSAVGPSDLCGLCGNKDGILNSSSGQRVTDIMDPLQTETFASSWKVEPSEQVLREDRRECADIRSDTVIGDPLLQVPLWMKDSDETRSLCYEVHGRSDSYFNLVSDECIIVNALYAQMGDLNVVSEIGVRAVTNEENCIAIKVAQVDHSCTTTLTIGNSTDEPMPVGMMYSQGGVQVRQQNQYRVRISVPNCEQVDLVMWATCEFNEGMPMMRFNISRGVNLRSTSHGLLGQFWNIPVTAEKVNDSALLRRLPQEYFNHDKIYMITVQPASSPARTFFGELFGHHWDSYKSPCMYSGNSQAGPSGEMYGLDHSIIEGVYTDYIVSDIFDADFPYNKFDDGKCSGMQG